MPIAHSPVAHSPRCSVLLQVKGGSLLLGGSSGSMVNDTWILQHNNWLDVSVAGAGVAPPGRCLSAMAAYKDGALLFGGYGATNPTLDDTWTWDPTAGWNELTLPVAPAGRNCALRRSPRCLMPAHAPPAPSCSRPPARPPATAADAPLPQTTR